MISGTTNRSASTRTHRIAPAHNGSPAHRGGAEWERISAQMQTQIVDVRAARRNLHLGVSRVGNVGVYMAALPTILGYAERSNFCSSWPGYHRSDPPKNVQGSRCDKHPCDWARRRQKCRLNVNENGQPDDAHTEEDHTRCLLENQSAAVDEGPPSGEEFGSSDGVLVIENGQPSSFHWSFCRLFRECAVAQDFP